MTSQARPQRQLPLTVFRADELRKSTEEILSDEGIRKQCSDDLDRLWTTVKP